MIRHIFSLICEQAFEDKDTNNISAFKIIEQISGELSHNISDPIEFNQAKFPEELTIPINYVLVSLLQRSNASDNENCDFKAQLFDPDSKELAKFEINDLELKIGQYNMRNKIHINGFRYTKNGIYTFRFYLRSKKDQKFKEVCEYPLRVSVAFQEP